ncbi:MAG: glucose-methanol-choline oxidoreductase [Hyphomicrobiales bacterium]|nr:glucose-methanol-choline oxidoreductase [Hyphomicrobiales bacterium]
MKSLDPSEHRLLRAAIDCIIPADQDPGATDLDVDEYILGQLAGDVSGQAETIMSGLCALDAEAVARNGAPFAALGVDDQTALLRETEHQPWFQLLVELTAEGFYADPGNGGNRGAYSWRMIGYQHRLPDGPSATTRRVRS